MERENDDCQYPRVGVGVGRGTAGGSVWELEPEVQLAEELVLVAESRRGCMVAEECWALTRWLHWIGQWDGKLGRLVEGAQAFRRQRGL